MRLTEEDIKEFQEIWKREFEETLPADIALEKANQLLEFYSIVLRINITDKSD